MKWLVGLAVGFEIACLAVVSIALWPEKKVRW